LIWRRGGLIDLLRSVRLLLDFLSEGSATQQFHVETAKVVGGDPYDFAETSD
jgi:hypothetical protein